ncbi:putative UPF0481 protein At3g02645 [Sorghum bicolor]|uniref:Uncharacterized protein n=1 Tax=Sorghum bicolor TaxID=4558 RepID=C5Z5F8_SORBI|nr:putative UPF0481 protein At3g02645 [Sorghum bicolor]EER87965.1 hypothetical protein SORBI_3010G062300 [Sorghum bicolor]|eukprot:XP_002436598.1 putative UPF0481 protein At3g02645 [Sorghum bicolor]
MASSDQHDTSRHGTPLVFDEVRWVVQIRQSLEEDAPGDDDDDTGIPVSVFNVPKPLQVYKPEAYTPQFIALGPYHHWRPELYEMERYKLAAARRAQKRLSAAGLKLDALVQQFARLERKIRAYYHRYLDFNGETLAWMMLVDGAFLLEFLQVYAVAAANDGGDVATAAGDGKALRRVTSRMQHLVDFAGRKSAHSLILRDMLMLENQVPLFLLRRILEPQCASPGEAGELLPRMVTGLMKELCPFKMLDKFPAIDVGKHAHLLEVLYYLLVPKPAGADDGAAAEADADAHGSRREDGYDIEEQQPVDGGAGDEEERPAAAGCEYVKQLLVTVSSMASGLNSGRMRYVTRPLAFAVKAPWKMLTVVPGFSAMKQPVEAFFTSGADGGSTHPHDANGGGAGYLTRPPLIEEIMIPSVSELANVGIQFCPTSGDLSTIAFDARTVTFQLPVVTLDSNTEVVLRNLVAYEASAASTPLVLARYTELMNGIIDTDEDVALLRRRGVVLNRMKSDGEVAKLWNGMSRSVRLTKVAFMDRAVEEVNRYYNSRWRVKTKRFMRKYVFSSWQLLTFLAAIMMLLLTTLQAFCSVYTCSRWFGTVTVATAE